VAKKGIEHTIEDMEAGREIRFADLAKVCVHYFGAPRQQGTSHHVYKMPWPGDPRVNIQNDKGKAKAYQVRQVLKAIAKLEELEKARSAKR
jgi:predicted DNA-binding protein